MSAAYLSVDGHLCLLLCVEWTSTWRHSWLPAPTRISARDVDIKTWGWPTDSHGNEWEDETSQWNDGWEQGLLFSIVNTVLGS